MNNGCCNNNNNPAPPCPPPMPKACEPICSPPEPDCHSHNHKPDMVLAMAYVLPQCFKGINDSFDSFKNGSIFPELIKPFTGKDGCR